MINGTNFFSMHRQILDQTHSAKAAIQSTETIGKKQVESIEKLAEIKKGAKAFESYFIQSLLKEMRKGVPKSEESGVGLGQDLYESMFDEEIAKKISESGGIGLAKMLTEKLSRSLESTERPLDQIEGPKVFKAIRR